MNTPVNRRMRRLLAAAIATLGLVTGAAQLHAQTCGTTPTPQQLEHLRSTAEARSMFDVTNFRSGIVYIPVKVHVISRADGTGAPSSTTVNSGMAALNSEFRNAGIQFYECGPRSIISSDVHFDHDISEEYLLEANYEQPNVLNIYLPGGSVSVGSNQVGGYAYLPPSKDRIFIDYRGGNSVWIHEVGHYFSLMHTHGPANNVAGTTELVNGSNCAVAGDLICDTPADPNLYGHVNPACTYTGTFVDANSQPYTPDTRNYMAYTQASCRNRFSATQRAWMLYSALQDRANLTCASSHDCATEVNVFPHTQSWENTLGSWVQSTTDDFNWTNRTGSTPTTQSGPDAAAAGSYYMYIEATGNTGGKRATLTSPCFSMLDVVRPQIQFSYHMYGANTDSLRMEVSTNGYTWTTRWSAFGDKGNSWFTATVDISDLYMIGRMQVRFTAKTAASGDKGDIAIDNFRILSNPCAGTTISVTKTDNSCFSVPNGSATLNVSGTGGPWTYLWSNGSTTSSLTGLGGGLHYCTVTSLAGCSTLVAVPVEQTGLTYTAVSTPETAEGSLNGAVDVTITGGPTPVTYLWSSGATTQDISGLASGKYSFTLTDANGCAVSDYRNVEYATRCQSGTITSYPYTESFEAGMGGWYNEKISDHFDITRHTGSTPTPGTGPDAASQGAYYLYAEASAPNSPGKRCVIYSPCFDLSGLTDPHLGFDVHMMGSQLGNLQLEAEIVGGATSPLIYADVDLGAAWTQAQFPIGGYVGGQTSVRFKFIFTTGPGEEGDIAIDNITLRECGTTTVTTDVVPESCRGNDGAISINWTGTDSPYSFHWTDDNSTVPTRTGLTAGGYEFYLASQSGCIWSNLVGIDPYAPTYNTSAITNATCATAGNGAINITTWLGVEPYTYLWSNGATTQDISNVPAGAYTVTVTDAVACTTVTTYNVGITEMTLAATSTNESFPGANNATLNLTRTGGAAPVTYLWSNGATTEDLSGIAGGSYTVTATDAAGCTKTGTFSVTTNPGCTPSVATFPYSESFEAGLGVWTQLTTDNFNWTRTNASTPTSQTGPSAAFNGSYYLFTEATGNSPSKTAILESQCFNLVLASAATLTFNYHMHGSQMGTLKVLVSTNQGSSWATAWGPTTANVNAWQSATVSLTPYVGSFIKIRFEGITGAGDRSDMGIDNIGIAVSTSKTEALPEPGEDGSPIANLVLYPNPTAGEVNLDFTSTQSLSAHLVIMDMAGHVIRQEAVQVQAGSNHLRLDAFDLPAGMYLARLADGQHHLTQKFILTK